MSASAIYIVGALALESASLWQLGGAHAHPANPAGFIGLHVLACLVAAITVPRLLPVNYRRTTWAGRLFFFLIPLCMPLFGMLGITLGLVPALWHQRTPSSRPNCLYSQALKLRSTASSPQLTRAVTGDGRLMGVLQHCTNQGSRLHALIATLSLDDQHAVPLLRIGLKDKDDDVRLLAYSLLMRKEKALEESIGKSITQLDRYAADRGFALQRALAQDFWELAGLGNNGRTATFLLEQARSHAQAGLRLQPEDAGLHLILGRIFLRQCNFGGARAAFLRALAGGISARKVVPFLAETAFHQRQFTSIGSYLKLEEFAAARFPLNHIAAYWDGASHDS